MQSQIKIVKRRGNTAPVDSQTEIESKPVEQSAREITIVVKKWVAELKERKSSHNSNFTPLKATGNQAS